VLSCWTMFLSPRSAFHDRIKPVVSAVLPEDPIVMGIQNVCLLVSLVQTCLQILQSLLIIFCTVDGGIFKIFVIIYSGTLFWNCSTIYRHNVFAQCWTYLYFWETLSLQKWFFKYPIVLLICQLKDLVATHLTSFFKI